MVKLDIASTRHRLQEFQFHQLFIEELGWSQPSIREIKSFSSSGLNCTAIHIAHLGGVAVMEIAVSGGSIPSSQFRKDVHKEISKAYHENLLIFVDGGRTKSVWYWIKREAGKRYVREHYYFKGQPGDLFLSKLSSMVVDIGDLDENGDIHVTEAVARLKDALDIERVTKKFFNEFAEQRLEFADLITGIKNANDRRWYASVLLNRLMFIYFMQKKGFIDGGNQRYLQDKFEAVRADSGKDKFYHDFLMVLFFEGFARPPEERSAKARKLIGEVKYLNGGLFLPHRIEIDIKGINVPDKAFENVLKLFESYSWNLDDTPGGKDDEINPDVLGYIFEKYINQKAFGAYYTRPEITEYLCERTIYKLILDRVNNEGVPGVIAPTNFKSISELLLNLDAALCRQLLNDVLPKLSLLDPACGSGAFLVAAMKTLINLYSAVIGRIEFINDRNLKTWLASARKEHPSINYFIKKRIITDNLYGVDIMDEATEIAKLRLFLALISSAQSIDELEPLPNIDFNIMAGNSLIGLMHLPTNEQLATHGHQQDMFKADFHSLVQEKDRLIEQYRHAATYAEDLRALKKDIETKKSEAQGTMNEILLDEFKNLGIKFEQATWDEKKKKEGKPIKRDLKIEDVERLKPFHWGYEFDEIILKKGGFDAIITNPPWEIFKPNGKEFFEEYSDLVTKKKMSIKDFEKEQAKLLKDEEVRKAWLKYLDEYPYVNCFFRSSAQYKNQISLVDGQKAGTDINLFKLFTEQCFNLLRKGGECGIVIPSGIYTDLGTKQLREMLFGQTEVTGLFCFENRKEIFENVHRSFKFVVLTFKKGGSTTIFPAKFMRHDVAELEIFPFEDAIQIDIELIKAISPDSLSVIEFKDIIDIRIVRKMISAPPIKTQRTDIWNIEFHREFHMTDDAFLFKESQTSNRLPLFEGKMIWHFDHKLSEPKFWIDEKQGRKALIGSRNSDVGQKLGYQKYRLAYRAVASNTNERSLVCTILPKTFTGNSLNVCETLDFFKMLFSVSLLNSFVLDWMLRLKVTTNLNMFYLYQLPVPRLTSSDKYFKDIVSRAARLICTTPEFNDLAKEVGLGSYKNGESDPDGRARLRAEIDGIIANLYELTEDEFKHILSTFPLVPQQVKDAALEQFRVFAPKSVDEEVLALIRSGESHSVEFKETARWDVKLNQQSKVMEKVILDTVAAFLNADGGTLFIGVRDDKTPAGLKSDFKLFGSKDPRDAYENWLIQHLLNQYGKDIAPCIKVSFHAVNGEDICRVSVAASSRPVYVKENNNEQFFIRAGNSKKQLSTSEAVDYCKKKWPS